jgi:hypothetical protein
MSNNFIENLRRKREAASATPEAPEKPAEQMSDAELEEAITASRRQLLDLQHQELREREIARVTGAAEATEQPQASGLAEVLRGLQKQKRRTWR